MIIQCAVTAGAAWLLASLLLGHHAPYFAAAAAILVLGVAYGQRLRRGVDVAIGVTVGVALGDIWLLFFGIGVWQIALVCAIAMSVATLVGAGPLMTTQAGAQSIAVLVLAPSLGYGVERWLDAVIGCVLALLVATVAPSGPLRRPRVVASKVVAGMAETLEAAADAWRAMTRTPPTQCWIVPGQRKRIWLPLMRLHQKASRWCAIPRSVATNSAWQLHWPTCTHRLITRAATCGS